IAMDPLVSTEELAASLGADDLCVFDCTVYLRRGDDDYVIEPGRADFEAGHIPGSAFLDQVAELSDPDSALRFTALDPDALAAAFAARGVGPDTQVVLYDRAFNMWATRVWWLLRSIGFDRASVLDGGWKAWSADGHDVESGAGASYPAAELSATPRPGLIVGQAEVEAATANDQVCLINALSPEVHDGSDTTYGRPGHIPSSTNVFAVSLVDPETHRYRPVDELAATFGEAGVDDGRIITWCGGGIAATSDAFILTALLGRDDVAIYDGSLSEWVAAGLPLET
ncbi:MAG: rhodanese-like domain-containing protein, partial [Actinomycetota bacterium]